MRRRAESYYIIKLRGLDENRMYRDMDTGEVYSGALLMKAGINMTPVPGYMVADDGNSVKKYFKAVE